MGRYGFAVIDADGHRGEPVSWCRRVPNRFQSQMVEYARTTKDHCGRATKTVPDSWPADRRVSHRLQHIVESGLLNDAKAAILGATADVCLADNRRKLTRASGN